MPKYITAEDMRALEKRAIDSGAVTGLALMERAGEAVVAAVAEHRPQKAKKGRAVVLCGPGNNGGDGFVVARRLLASGWRVQVFFYGNTDMLPPDARSNRDRWAAMDEARTHVMGFPDVTQADVAAFEDATYGKPPADVLVDALFGIGLSRPLDGLAPLLAVIGAQAESARGTTRVSIDVPSGLAETGPLDDAANAVFPADLTVTFHRPKEAHRHAARFCGKLVVADIGLQDGC